MFDDLLDANRRYASSSHDATLEGRALKELAVLTCMDSRLDPLAMLGIRAGDAKIIRNAGARVTDDALRSLVLATNLLGARRVCVIQHTGCAMVGATEDEMRDRVRRAHGRDASAWTFLTTQDQEATLRADVERVRACDLIDDDVEVGGFVFDVLSGQLVVVDA